jgi:hypothetical protein
MSDKFYCFQPDCALSASNDAESLSLARRQCQSSDFFHFGYPLLLLYLRPAAANSNPMINKG